MSAEELLKKVIASGADGNGIRDRFNGNVDLYARCFLDFMDEPDFVKLRDSIHTRDYEQAFEAAHALKGLSGNLGVTAFYNAIRALVRSLRDKQYENLETEYAEVERQHEILKRVISDKPPIQGDADHGREDILGQSGFSFQKTDAAIKKDSSRQVMCLLCASAAVIFLLGMLFFRMILVHEQTVIEESGQYLTEMSNQIKMHLEEHMATNWKIAQSVGSSILDSGHAVDTAAIVNKLRENAEIWGVSDVILNTEDGRFAGADGSLALENVAAAIACSTGGQGKCVSVAGSKIIYTIPLETTLTYAQAKVTALSVVCDMSTVLEEMEFSSFGGAAWMCLTDQDGNLVSALNCPFPTQATSIQTVVQDMEVTPLEEGGLAEEFLLDPDVAAFLLSDGTKKTYGVSAPIMTGDETFRFFYFVPMNVANSAMSGFSKQLVTFSLLIVALFAACAFLTSVFVYKGRKRAFDQAILARERMFNLLIKDTKTAFGLFSINQAQPVYLSANAADVLGDSFWAVNRTEAGFCVHNDQNIETGNIVQVNEALKAWDGKSAFRSGYLCNAQKATPTYFVFELYPVNEAEENFVAIAQDVTSMHAREDAAKNALEMAKRANQAKTQFLSNMSHDIRTPMNAIMNMTNFAMESFDQPKMLRSYLQVIHESSEHLLQLINDVLDMSRIESGRIEITSAPFDVKEEIQQQVDMIRPLCSAKNQTLMTDFGGIKETTVCGDSLKLSQIIMNLLSNAVKFTPERGAVRFTAREIPSLRDQILTVRFTIEDNGIGISDVDRMHIFDPFSRANDKSVSRIEGSGLGLSICKNYVEAMGGTIRCDSTLGEGTVFTVELFFQKAETSPKHDESRAVLTDASFLGMRALVAEDNYVNRVIVKKLLGRMGFIMDFVEDGVEAVQKFKDAAPGTYDVIYMDIQMPVMDGYEATTQIRGSGHPQAKTIPIIAMTANAFAEDIEKARMVGMNAYVDKPIIAFNLAEQTKKAIIFNKRQ